MHVEDFEGFGMVRVKTWIVRAHACQCCSIYCHAQYSKGHRFVCSRCSTTPFAAQARPNPHRYMYICSFHIAVRYWTRGVGTSFMIASVQSIAARKVIVGCFFLMWEHIYRQRHSNQKENFGPEPGKGNFQAIFAIQNNTFITTHQVGSSKYISWRKEKGRSTF